MTTRRNFLKQAGVLGTGLGVSSVISPQVMASIKQSPPSDRVNVAVIGVGMGCANLNGIMENKWAHCVGMCDVDQERLETQMADFKRKYPDQTINLKLYQDFRDVLYNEDIDAVIIATPDHWHTYMFCEALKAGKAIYIEKPVANSIEECNIMTDFQKKYRGIVTTGLWQTSQRYFRGANDILRTGILGDVYKVHIWLCQGTDPHPIVADSAAPSTLDWNMWLGPAPERIYNQSRHRNWRSYWDYGGGQQTDWGVHWLDSAFDGLEALGLNNRTFPKAVFSSAYKHPDTFNETPSVQSTIFEYENFHIEWAQQVAHLYNRDQGVAWIGSNGTLVCNRNGYELIPVERGESKLLAQPYQMTGPFEYRGVIDHATNWGECIRKGTIETNSPIEKGAFSTILAHMANISYRTGTKIVYNSKTCHFENNPIAEAFLKPLYRDPWKLPTL